MSSNQLILAVAIAFGSVGAASAATPTFEGGQAGNPMQAAVSATAERPLTRDTVKAELLDGRRAQFVILEGGQAAQRINAAQQPAGMTLDRMAVRDALLMEQQRHVGVQRVYEGGESSRVR